MKCNRRSIDKIASTFYKKDCIDVLVCIHVRTIHDVDSDLKGKEKSKKKIGKKMMGPFVASVVVADQSTLLFFQTSLSPIAQKLYFIYNHFTGRQTLLQNLILPSY